jgi:carboxyl-terminal processing protease
MPALGYAVAMFFGLYIGMRAQKSMSGSGKFNYDKNNKISELLNLIANRYVDQINTDSLGNILYSRLEKSYDSTQDAIITQTLASLDPHSVYIPTQELKGVNNQIKGQFTGFGIAVQKIGDTFYIAKVAEKSAADVNGLLVGDALLAINDKSLYNKNYQVDSVTTLLRKVDGAVKFLVVNNGVKKEISLTKSTIDVNSIETAYMLNATDGYMKLTSFTIESYNEFKKALTDLQQKGMKNLMLDLRDNSGGVAQVAASIADEFLDGNKLISFSQGVHQPKTEYVCKQKGSFEQGKLIVLINGFSASASELLCGALQDWNRATVIGSRSYGKGLVQQQFGLVDGSAIRLTIARYYTPKGRSLQKRYELYKKADTTGALQTFGIEPTVLVDNDTAWNRFFVKNYHKFTDANQYLFKTYLQYRPQLKQVNSLNEYGSILSPTKLANGFLAQNKSLDSALIRQKLVTKFTDWLWTDFLYRFSKQSSALQEANKTDPAIQLGLKKFLE